jgi:hypothetical protein
MDFNFFEKYGKLNARDLRVLLMAEQQKIKAIEDFVNSSIVGHECSDNCHKECMDKTMDRCFQELLTETDI